MEWDNKNPNGLPGLRRAGLFILGLGAVILAAAIILIMSTGSAMGPILLIGSIFVNTLAIILLRKKR